MDQTIEIKTQLKTEKERLEIRKRIRADAANLCEYVVKTSIEYKEELIRLEKDNQKLKKKNKYLKNTINNLKNNNNFLCEEIDSKNKNLIKILGCNEVCFNCNHLVSCKKSKFLCSMCLQWMCSCCIDYCLQNECLNKVCNSCSSECFLHSNFSEEIKKELLDEYQRLKEF
jgi:cell division protein FtsB